MNHQISVIIPTYNEHEHIHYCLTHLIDKGSMEIIIADSPNSNLGMEAISDEFDCVYLRCKKAGRNHQMNEAAKKAKGNVLYFVHADTQVKHNYVKDINEALNKGVELGCYRYKFDKYPNPLMYINSYFTKFPMLWCRGGDQTLFVKEEVFKSLNGFCQQHTIMEDYDFLKRSYQNYNFAIIPKDVIVSSRKYDKNGYLKVQWANFTVMRKWLNKKAHPEELGKLYQQMLKS